MSWTPTKKVVDLTKIVDNLIDFIEDEQTDAHTWANEDTAMPDYAALYPNAAGRLSTVFPQLIVLNQEFTEDEGEGGELLISTLALTIEVALTGPNADDLVLKTKRYDLALRSMLKNIPSATLASGRDESTVPMHIDCISLQTAFDVLRGQGGKTSSSWLQIFQTKVEYQVITNAF